jgi:membrane peptidoglycan carboxypeptidase
MHLGRMMFYLREDAATVAAVVRRSTGLCVAEPVLRALVLAEDRRFAYHPGIDPIAILRVLLRWVLGNSMQGASTIEQQLVRTVTRRYERSLTRKLREIIVALWLSAIYDKKLLAKAYLSVAYFGWHMNGAVEACRRLGISLATAEASEAAALIARLKYPEARTLRPYQRRRITSRAEYILQVMSREVPTRMERELHSPSAEV